MKLDTKESDNIRQYLLGRLRPQAAEPIEERLLSDTHFFQELLIAEDELIDEYLGGKLSEAERSAFEGHFLAAPERQQSFRFARNLKRYIKTTTATKLQTESEVSGQIEIPGAVAEFRAGKRRPFSFLPQNPILSYAVAAAIGLVVVSALWLALKNWDRVAPRQPGDVLAVVLTPGLTRESGEIKTIQLPDGVDTLRLRLQITDSDYLAYRVELENQGNGILERSNLRSEVVEGRRIVVFDVPADLLAVSDYRLNLSGVAASGDLEPVSAYYFRIVSR